MAKTKTDEEILMPDLKEIEVPYEPKRLTVLRFHLAATFMLARLVAQFAGKLDITALMQRETPPEGLTEVEAEQWLKGATLRKAQDFFASLLAVSESEGDVCKLLASLLARPDGTTVAVDYVRLKLPLDAVLEVVGVVLEQEDLPALVKKAKALGATFRKEPAEK